MKTLEDYQKFIVNYIYSHPICGLFVDMGLGKTVSVLTAFSFLKQRGKVRNCLVAAPKNVALDTWEAEVREWDHYGMIKDLKIQVIHGTVKQRLKQLKEPADIYTISVDGLKWLCSLYGFTYLPYDMFVLDESTKMKGQNTERFKVTKNGVLSIPRRVIMSGTPAPNSYLDLWAQIYLLDKGARLGHNITTYRKRFFSATPIKNSPVPKYTLIPGAKEEIDRLLSDICISMECKDYAKDLPDCHTVDISLLMPDSIKEKYNSFKKNKVLELINNESGKVIIPRMFQSYINWQGLEPKITDIFIEIPYPNKEYRDRLLEWLKQFSATYKANNLITSKNALSLSSKLMQFASGAIYYDGEKEFLEIHSIKIEALRQIARERGRGIFVAVNYDHEKVRILKYLAEFNPVVYKGVKEKTKWNDGQIKMLLAQPKSAAHGLNLQKGGNTVVWFSETWNLEEYLQFIKRIHRRGQTEPVTVYRLILKGTEDERVAKALEGKDTTQKALLASLKANIKEIQQDKLI